MARLLVCKQDHAVLRHKDKLDGIRIERMHCPTSYAIAEGDEVKLLIEHTTLSEYARTHANFYTERDALTLYIIEGNKTNLPKNSNFTVLSDAIIDLSEKAFVVRTENSIYTAELLRELTLASGSLSALKNPLVLTTYDYTREAWSAFVGISVESASEYMLKWSLSDIIRGVSRYVMHQQSTASGARIPNVVIDGLTNPGPYVVDVLKKLPGMKYRAQSLLNTIPMKELIDAPVDRIARVRVGKTHIGNDTAQLIYDVLRCKLQPHPDDPPEPPRATGYSNYSSDRVSHYPRQRNYGFRDNEYDRFAIHGYEDMVDINPAYRSPVHKKSQSRMTKANTRYDESMWDYLDLPSRYQIEDPEVAEFAKKIERERSRGRRQDVFDDSDVLGTRCKNITSKSHVSRYQHSVTASAGYEYNPLYESPRRTIPDSPPAYAEHDIDINELVDKMATLSDDDAISVLSFSSDSDDEITRRMKDVKRDLLNEPRKFRYG